MPMSASAVVNRGELLARLDELGRRAGGGLRDAQTGGRRPRRPWSTRGARRPPDRRAGAQTERETIISDTEVFRVAKREADGLLEQARTEAEELRKETDDYVDAKLANFEITLERTIEAVRRGRERLAGRIGARLAHRRRGRQDQAARAPRAA